MCILFYAIRLSAEYQNITKEKRNSKKKKAEKILGILAQIVSRNAIAY